MEFCLFGEASELVIVASHDKASHSGSAEQLRLSHQDEIGPLGADATRDDLDA